METWPNPVGSFRTPPMCWRPNCLALVVFLWLANTTALSSATPAWHYVGPRPISGGQTDIKGGEVEGAVQCIAAHPTNARIAYVGSVNGGIWKTTNADSPHPHWGPLNTGSATSIRAIEFDPLDTSAQTLIAGVGRTSSYLSVGSALAGVLRTVDGGVTWATVNGKGGPDGSNVTGVAARGSVLVAATIERGILRSDNGGAMWSVLSDDSTLPSGPSFDLTSDPADPKRLYTNAGAAGIYRSVNAGETWTKVSTQTVDSALAGAVNVKLAVNPGHVLFVAVGGSCRTDPGRPPFCGLAGLFRFDEAKQQWVSLDLPRTIEQNMPEGTHPGGQASRHLSLAADPKSSWVVYIGGDRQPSKDEGVGGNTFPNSIGAESYNGRSFRVDGSKKAGMQATPLTNSGTQSNTAPHADSRAMRFAADGSLLEGDDGGIYRRTNPSTKGGDWSSLSGDLEITELHAIAWDSVSGVAFGGAQDTGVPQQDHANAYPWASLDVGDGAETAVDATSTPGNSMRYESTEDLGNFNRMQYEANGNRRSTDTVRLRLLDGADPIEPQFYTPIRINAQQSLRMVLGGANSVYESDDQGDSVAVIGLHIVANASATIAYGAADNADSLYVGGATLNADPTNPGTLTLGYGNELFGRTSSTPATLEKISNYPGQGAISGVAMDPAAYKSVIVVEGTDLWYERKDPAHVWMTLDAGSQWREITGNLTALCLGHLTAALLLPYGAQRTAVVGCDTGVFYSLSSAGYTVWSPLGTGLPSVAAVAFAYDSGRHLLITATLGRGAWALDVSNDL
jgi:photosystem II stability/assembly factor-like uncharacterized protein